jgi:hypothetical protein
MTLRWPAWLKFGEEQPFKPEKTVWLCYENPVWVATLRRHLSPDVRLRRAPNLQFVREKFASGLPSFAIYEWQPAELEDFLSLTHSLKGHLSAMPLVVLLNRGTIAQEITFRALGVMHVVLTPQKVPELAKIVDRYFESLPRWSWPESELAPIPLPWRE